MKTFHVSGRLWGNPEQQTQRDTYWEVNFRKGCRYALLDLDDVGEYFLFTNRRRLCKFVGNKRCGQTVIDINGGLFYCNGKDTSRLFEKRLFLNFVTDEEGLMHDFRTMNAKRKRKLALKEMK